LPILILKKQAVLAIASWKSPDSKMHGSRFLTAVKTPAVGVPFLTDEKTGCFNVASELTNANHGQ
jgi:hypothetical protein